MSVPPSGSNALCLSVAHFGTSMEMDIFGITLRLKHLGTIILAECLAVGLDLSSWKNALSSI